VSGGDDGVLVTSQVGRNGGQHRNSGLSIIGDHVHASFLLPADVDREVMISGLAQPEPFSSAIASYPAGNPKSTPLAAYFR